VYAPKRTVLTLEDRTIAAWLWSGREGVVKGLAASAMLGAKWVDDDIPIELNFGNHRPPTGVTTRNDTLLEPEIARYRGMAVTTTPGTSFGSNTSTRSDGPSYAWSPSIAGPRSCTACARRGS